MSAFIGDFSQKDTDDKVQPSCSAGSLCDIPREVPVLPDKFHHRQAPLEALIACLIQDESATVSVTAPKARNANNSVTSQGMGGCGKTMLTVSALHSPEVRHFFERIGWQPVSQTPNYIEIATKLFKQLFGEKLPNEVAADADLAFHNLKTRSKGRIFLVVLDDVSSYLFILT